MSHTDAWGYALIPLRNGREWEVVDDYTYARGAVRIEVKKDFVFDGASIPRALWSLIGAPQAGKHAHASLLHDNLYVYKALVRNGLAVDVTRRQADDLMLVVMKEDGVAWWRRNVIHRGVRLGGGHVWRT